MSSPPMSPTGTTGHSSHDLGRNWGVYGYSHYVMFNDIPVEIHGGDANAYVRLLKHEPWMKKVTAAIAAQFSCERITWQWDENRLSVSTQINQPGLPQTVNSWQDILQASQRGSADPTQKLIHGNAADSPNDSATVVPLRTGIVPPPNTSESQPRLAVSHPTMPYAAREATFNDFQTTRTSIPMLHSSRKTNALRVLRVAAVFAAFIGVVILVASTPTPFGSSKETILAKPKAPTTQPQQQALRVASAVPMGNNASNKDAAAPTQNIVISLAESQAHPQQDTSTETVDASEKKYSRRNTKSPSTARQSTLPHFPSRAAVKTAMNRVAPRIAKCSNGYSGQVVVRITFSGRNGRIQSSQIINPIIHSQRTAQCVQKAIRRAKLPPFEKEQLSIKYPFNLQ